LRSKIEEFRDKNYASRLLADIIIAKEDESRYEEARKYLKNGLAEVESHGDKRRIAYYYTSLAKLGYLTDPDSIESRKYAEDALNMFSELKMVQEEESTRKLLGRLPSNISNLKNKLNQCLQDQQNFFMCLDCRYHQNPDSPIISMYTEMIKYGYPDDNHNPSNYEELKLCWVRWERQQTRNSRCLNLIVYDSSGKNLNENFLYQLNNFGGNICIIDRKMFPQLTNLYHFYSNTPRLFDKIAEWLISSADIGFHPR